MISEVSRENPLAYLEFMAINLAGVLQRFRRCKYEIFCKYAKTVLVYTYTFSKASTDTL